MNSPAQSPAASMSAGFLSPPAGETNLAKSRPLVDRLIHEATWLPVTLTASAQQCNGTLSA